MNIPSGVPLLLAMMLIGVTGCATLPSPKATGLLQSSPHLAVLQLPPAVSDEHLRQVFHDGDKRASSDVLAADRSRLEQTLSIALRQALAVSEVPALASSDMELLDDAQGMAIGQPLDEKSLASLQKRYPADAYLRVRVTDYGLTPGSWKTAYVTFEVVTTAGIGLLLYVHKVTRPLAFAYLAEESVEELSEGYAGFWLVNRLSRPVRLDTDLVDGKTGQVLWHDSETGMADWHWAHLWHMDDVTREGLLGMSTAAAARGLVDELQQRR